MHNLATLPIHQVKLISDLYIWHNYYGTYNDIFDTFIFFFLLKLTLLTVTVYIDPNNNPGGGLLFSNKEIRNAFVSKVYTILSAQLLFTAALIAIFVYNPDIKSYFALNQLWLLLGWVIFFATLLILVCVESSRRSFPINFILLSILTIGMAFEAAVISCSYNTSTVLYAAATCAISTILITLFAKYTSFDMTSCGTVLYILGIIHMVAGLILILVLGPSNAKIGSLILSIFGAFLVMLYLVYDTQLIMGGRQEELSPEEYILGAILLYVDIVQMFLFLLQIFSSRSD